jgi:hypothetical protein
MSRAGALLLALITVAACSDGTPSTSAPDAARISADPPRAGRIRGRAPVTYAAEKLAEALREAGSTADVRLLLADDPEATALLAAANVAVDTRPESFAVLPSGSGAVVVGRDETGALYGALELVERLQAEGAAALPPPAAVTEAPATPIRGANLFLALPEKHESAWWFRDEVFWDAYLDLLARARINFLDLQGMYDVGRAVFPNALLYFGHSASHPEVGVPEEERAANVTMLRRVVDMARERGIRVGLLSNRGDDSLLAKNDGKLDPAALAVYTREAAASVARDVPALWRMGFRIGESKENASFFADSFIGGVREGSETMGIYTRTWLAAKDDILTLAHASGDLLIESKLNGEQIGAPYPIAGGLYYSYQDFLTAPEPYTFIFQIWGGGTHRIFRHASYARAKRLLEGVKLGGSRGFSLLATHAFMPQRDFYHAAAEDRFSPWAFRRDELEYLLYGRLAYDPGTPEQVFRDVLRRRTGTDALWDAVQAASEIVPWIQAAHTCGADQRQFAPDLEWGGTVAMWASAADSTDAKATCNTGYHGPYDTFALASPRETAHALVAGEPLATLSSLEVARLVLDAAARAREAAHVAVDEGRAEARDVVRECVALADLGDYFGHKLRAATALAVYDESGRLDYLGEATHDTTRADHAWEALGRDTGYIAPFHEPMRMIRLGMPVYHWAMQKTLADPASIDAVVVAPRSITGDPAALPPASTWLHAGRPEGPGLASIEATPPEHGGASWHVAVTLAQGVGAGAQVRVRYKGFSALADWQSEPAQGSGAHFEADVPGLGAAGFLAVEVRDPMAHAWSYPDVRTSAPYVVVDTRGVSAAPEAAAVAAPAGHALVWSAPPSP